MAKMININNYFNSYEEFALRLKNIYNTTGTGDLLDIIEIIMKLNRKFFDMWEVYRILDELDLIQLSILFDELTSAGELEIVEYMREIYYMVILDNKKSIDNEVSWCYSE